MNRRCNKCGEIKPLSDYGIDRTYANGRQLRKKTCKTCKAIQKKASNKLHKEHPKPDVIVCPICEKPTSDIVLDHDHDTFEFRGWLCNTCNSGLGKFGDDKKRLGRAIAYLSGYGRAQ